jgi:hypothetical protein
MDIPIGHDIDVMLARYDEKLGKLIDISPTGLSIRGDEPVEVFDQINLELRLKERILGKKTITVTAVCMWCEQDADPRCWLSNFEFYEISQEDRSAIIGLILGVKKLA